MFHFSLPAVAQTGRVSLDFSSLAHCCLPRGAEFGTDCGNNRKTSSCLSFSFFSLEQHYCSLKSQNTSSLVLLRVQMVPVIMVPEFPVDVRLNWAQTATIILHFISWTGFSLPYVRSSLWAASRPLTSCIPLLLAICCLAQPSWSEAKRGMAQHMCEHAVTSLPFFSSIGKTCWNS